jgi:phosphopantothenoylcysteine decarboxylase/phosphopantothenate--cysteine ligase
METAVLDFCRKNRVDFYVSAAAISDFSPARIEGKIPSGREITLLLRPLPKLLPLVSGACGKSPVIVAFKLGHNEEQRAREMIGDGATMVIVNGPDVMGSGSGTFVILTRDNRDELTTSKDHLAVEIWKKLL